MNEQLQAALAQLIEMVTAGASALYEFGAEQVPLVLQQLLLWHAVQSAVYFTFWLAGFLLSVYCLASPVLYRPGKHVIALLFGEYRDDGTMREMYPTILLPFLGLFSILGVLSSLAWLKIWLAPNLYLLEYATKLVK